MDEQKINSAKPLHLLLDSRLILATSKSLYDLKLVECGDYVQLYFYDKKKSRSNNKDSDLNLKKSSYCYNDNKNNLSDLKSLNQIEIRNIIRSKLECQRIAKSNMKYWKTFVTLTFSENITNVAKAMKKFKYFVDKIRRVKKDFMYLCITEFQKRGAVHYHLLTNIDINDNTLMYTQEDNNNFRHIKYWLDGFSSVQSLNGDEKKVIGYISKYMTKDIDNRLFNKHRYFYSRNLIKPISSFINLDNTKEKEFYIKKIQEKELIYKNNYVSIYDNSKVSFLEFSSSHNNIL